MRALVVPLLLAVAFALVGAVSPAAAHKPRPRPMMKKPVVTMSLVSGDGMALPSAMHRGQTFVAGEKGERYAIRLTNNTMTRVEVVVAVDGRDVVSGKRADFRTQRGYVLGPRQTIEIEGFRQSLERVATFRFSSVARSYAARRGSKRNVGRITVAAFKEKPRMMHRHAKKSKAAAPSSRARQELGTEYGESRMSGARRVTFDRQNAKTPDFRTALLYDSARALAARGIMVETGPIAVDDGFAPAP